MVKAALSSRPFLAGLAACRCNHDLNPTRDQTFGVIARNSFVIAPELGAAELFESSAFQFPLRRPYPA